MTFGILYYNFYKYLVFLFYLKQDHDEAQRVDLKVSSSRKVFSPFTAFCSFLFSMSEKALKRTKKGVRDLLDN
jgi:hypothetical protein